MSGRSDALALLCALLLTGAARAETEVRLSLDGARELAAAAITGDAPALGREIAIALVGLAPDAASGWALLAGAELALGRPGEALRAGRAAWRRAASDTERYEAARLTALAAAQEGRFTLAQIWLRRALTVAPSEADAAQTVRDYRLVRARNPWSAELRFSLAPSDNVNGGAESPYNIIDGFPVVGLLSPDARALSGWAGTIDLRATYRLRETEASRLLAGARVWGRGVRLSEAARRFLAEEQDPGDPPITDRDFSSALAEVSLSWDRAVPAGALGLDLAAGRAWSGGAAEYDYLRLSADRGWAVSDSAALTLAAFAEQRREPGGAPGDARIGAQAEWRQVLAWGAQVTGGAAWERTLSDNGNARAESWTLTASYAPAAPIGPLSAELLVGVQWTAFPDYAVIFPVPGGRRDERVFADLTLGLPWVDYAGFTPVVTLGWDSVDSNVSRFDRDGFSVEFAIRSSF